MDTSQRPTKKLACLSGIMPVLVTVNGAENGSDPSVGSSKSTLTRGQKATIAAGTPINVANPNATATNFRNCGHSFFGFGLGRRFGISFRSVVRLRPLDSGMIGVAQMSSNLTVSASIAMSDANRNVAENVPRLILLAMLASVSVRPCFFSRSASSRYPTSARASSALRNRFARSSQEGVLLP